MKTLDDIGRAIFAYRLSIYVTVSHNRYRRSVKPRSVYKAMLRIGGHERKNHDVYAGRDDLRVWHDLPKLAKIKNHPKIYLKK